MDNAFLAVINFREISYLIIKPHLQRDHHVFYDQSLYKVVPQKKGALFYLIKYWSQIYNSKFNVLLNEMGNF